MRISDWSSDVCSSDLFGPAGDGSFTFDRGDGHREPLYASGEGLVGPDSGIILKAISPANGPAGIITYTRIGGSGRSEEHTSELQSLMRISYAVFCLKKKKTTQTKRRAI